MKKLLIGLMCAAMLCTCGCSGITASKSLDGDYVSLGCDLMADDYGYDFADDELDEFLEETCEGDNTVYSVELDEDEFKIDDHNPNSDCIFKGTYELDEDGKIEFEYKTTKTSLQGEQVKVDINKSAGGFAEKAIADRMEALNENNDFPYLVGSFGSTYTDKMAGNHIYLPALNMGVIAPRNGFPLYAKGGFLCREAYGAELEKNYKYGKDFTMSYNYLDTLENDETSSLYSLPKDERKDYISKLQSTLAYSMDVDGDSRNDFDTTIEFRDGEWEWYNKNGDLINNGEYQESEEYKGLIVMYVTDDSENYYENAGVRAQRMFLYIHDGEIYAPVFIKTS